MLHVHTKGVVFPDSLARKVEQFAESNGLSFSQAVVKIIEDYFGRDSYDDNDAADIPVDLGVGDIGIIPRDHYADGGSYSVKLFKLIRRITTKQGRRTFFYTPIMIYTPRSEMLPGYPVYISDRFAGVLTDATCISLRDFLDELVK